MLEKEDKFELMRCHMEEKELFEKNLELDQRVKALETKVKILEETLNTLKNMQVSEQMGEYIQSKEKSLKLVNLINTVSDKKTLDFSKEEDSIQSVRSAKHAIDRQIAAALRNSGDFSEQYPDDPRYFNYEIESGIVTGWNGRKEKDNNLSQYVGKGLRITSYNGFGSERVIVPKEIEGQPVISIGENAFKNASFSELILPGSLKAILEKSFQGCKNLKHIDLPEGLEYLGKYCFSGTGLESLRIPDSVKVIPAGCFSDSKFLNTIVLGNNTRELGYSAFRGCTNLNQLSLPETVKTISAECFSDTAMKALIFPANVSEISYEIFGDGIRSVRQVTCVFLGKLTLIEGDSCHFAHRNIEQIYCLPGSNVQKFAREHAIPMKPLSEFNVESI